MQFRTDYRDACGNHWVEFFCEDCGIIKVVLVPELAREVKVAGRHRCE